jgi:hypothetical protein
LLPMAFNGVCGQLHALAALPSWCEPSVPIKYEAKWAAELVWMLWRSGNS